jgi:hypothetical protein
MRASIWLIALGLGFAFASPASAQRAFLWGGQNSGQSQVYADSSYIGTPIATPQTNSSPSFKLTSLFHPFSSFSAKPIHGSSNFPTPGNQPGADYLKAFKYRRGLP